MFTKGLMAAGGRNLLIRYTEWLDDSQNYLPGDYYEFFSI